MEERQRAKRATLTVQAKLHHDLGYPFAVPDIEEEVRSFLSKNYTEVRIGTLETAPSDTIERIEITSASKNSKFPDTDTYRLADHELKIIAYTLHTNAEHEIQSDEDGDSEGPFNVIELPHKIFDGQWEALVYEDPLAERLLRIFSRAIRRFHTNPMELLQNAWYSTALLYGVPGSGKTSLAQALAQKLSICLSDIYPRTRLLEVNSSAIFSHMYGNTPKEVGKMFTNINRLASETEEKSGLVVVLIDEIDKLVPCRQKIGNKNEPQDTIRATAEVLTGLDKIRRLSNVLSLFTTNLIGDLDPAFLDRCRLKEEVKAPVADGVFDIMRTVLNAKIHQGEIIVAGNMIYDKFCDTIMTDDAESHTYSAKSPHAPTRANIPTLTWASKHWPLSSHTAVSILHEIATVAVGLSARNLRGLVDVALFEAFAEDDVPELRNTLAALKTVIRREALQALGATHHEGSAMRSGLSSTTTSDDSDFDFVTDDLPIELNQYSDDE